MNRRFIIMLSIALLLSLLAAWVANRWIQGRAVPDTAMSVVVAAVEIPFGVKLEESQVKLIAWPGNSALPQGAYSSKEQVVNKVAMNKFYPDEIITEKKDFGVFGRQHAFCIDHQRIPSHFGTG